MKSLILISLYLFKDTLHRWKERPASPLSRVLVAFFLSLCALSFLANYVLSSKMLHDEIRKNGADLITVFDTVREGEASKRSLLQHELPLLHDCDVLALKDSPAGFAGWGRPFSPFWNTTWSPALFLPIWSWRSIPLSSCLIPAGVPCIRDHARYPSGILIFP